MKSTKTVLVLFTTYISNKLSLPSRWDVHYYNANHPFPDFLFWMQQKFSWFLWDFRYSEASNDTMIIAYYPRIVSFSNFTMWLHKGGVYLRERDAKIAAIFSFFIGTTSFFNIMGEMGASLSPSSFMRIRELLPPKFRHPEILLLPPLLTHISLASLQNRQKWWFWSLNWHIHWY